MMVANMQQKTNFYRTLMGVSLGLLVLFQTYWLQSVYRGKKELLETELDNLFVSNIRDLQDSLFRFNWISIRDNLETRIAVIQITRDSTQNKRTSALKTITFQRQDTTISDTRSGHNLDDVVLSLRGQDTTKVVKTLSSPTDFSHYTHSRTPETRLERRERFFKSGVQAFKSGMAPWPKDYTNRDSLRIPLLRNRLKKDMEAAGFFFPFQISRSDTVPNIHPSGGITTFHSGGFPPVQLYVVAFSEYQSFLLQRMWPNFLFALSLLSITALSFRMLFRNLQQQHKLAKIKNDFISNITHELKTPIATVSVALEALQNFQGLNDPRKVREYLEISQHELQRLSILVDRVLKMSMFENKALQLHPEPFDMRLSLEKVVQSMGLQFEKSKAQVHLHIEGSRFMVFGDPVHLTNVIYNLLDNALKYSPDHPRIEILLSESNGKVQLAVQDHGIGIPPEYQEKIFEQFFRVPQQGQQHNSKGYGLGLSYVAEVVRQHEGHIRVESSPSQGSRFTLSLPQFNGHLPR